MTYDAYVDRKIALEKTVANGQISSAQKFGAVLTTSIIEGTITRYLGTAPNSRALMKAFQNPNSNVAGALFRGNWQAAGNALWKTTLRTGGEVLEETSIEFLTSVIADTAILRDDFDLSQLDDVALQAVVMGGGMNAPGITYSTIITQMATSEFKKEGLTQLQALIEDDDMIFDISMTSKHGSSGLCMTVVYYLV